MWLHPCWWFFGLERHDALKDERGYVRKKSIGGGKLSIVWELECSRERCNYGDIMWETLNNGQSHAFCRVLGQAAKRRIKEITKGFENSSRDGPLAVADPNKELSIVKTAKRHLG